MKPVKQPEDLSTIATGELKARISEIDGDLALRHADVLSLADENGEVPPADWRDFMIWKGGAVAAKKRIEAELSRRNGLDFAGLAAQLHNCLETLRRVRAWALEVEGPMAGVTVALIDSQIERAERAVREAA